MSYEYTRKPMSFMDKVEAELKLNLTEGEHYINACYTYDTGIQYNVCYITNKGNILVCHGHSKQQIIVKQFNISESESYTNMEQKVIHAYTFKSTHYCKVKKEIEQLLEIVKLCAI
jgi:hypothetical protein